MQRAQMQDLARQEQKASRGVYCFVDMLQDLARARSRWLRGQRVNYALEVQLRQSYAAPPLINVPCILWQSSG